MEGVVLKLWVRSAVPLMPLGRSYTLGGIIYLVAAAALPEIITELQLKGLLLFNTGLYRGTELCKAQNWMNSNTNTKAKQSFISA